MLHTQTIERRTLELLKALMLDAQLAQFSLVGGTALALYMGHRLSRDVDLFIPEPSSNPIRALKGLEYHNDIRFDEEIVLLVGDYTWNTIRQRLAEMARYPKKTFTSYPVYTGSRLVNMQQ